MVDGFQPFSLAISGTDDAAIFANWGGGQGDLNVINVVDLKQNPPRIVDTVSAGQTLAGVSTLQDGAYAAVTAIRA
jgi:hypothetical protein